MRLNAPKFILCVFSWLVLQLSPALSAPVCSAKAVIGSVATAPSWVRARENARARWVSSVNNTVGQSFSHWRHARHRGYMCWAKGQTKYCKATARPCNGRAGLAAAKLNKQRAASQKRKASASEGNRASAASEKVERVPEKAKKAEQPRYGYFDQQLADETITGRRCSSRSIQISGKVLRTIKKAKHSAQSLWSEYIAITKGKKWSVWAQARKRRVQCKPNGYKVQCEVSAIACKTNDFDTPLQEVNKTKKQQNLLALPMKRPEALPDEVEEQDPGEYGDGLIDEDDGKIELPEKRDGFSLPWLIEPPAGRPEPEDGDGGPFGKNEQIEGFEVSKLEKGKANPSHKQNERLTKKQGSLTPALPAKRPYFDNLQAMLEEQNNYYKNKELSDRVAPIKNVYKEEQWEKADPLAKLKKSPMRSHLTLPFKRPQRVAKAQKAQGISVKRQRIIVRKNKNKRQAYHHNADKAEDSVIGANKTFQGWKVVEEANPNITRQHGKKTGKLASTRKFKRNKAVALEKARSRVRYTNSAAIVTNFKAVYGCKEEEVASWGQATLTKRQAQQQAIRSWQKLIYAKYGKNWSDWMRAGSSRVQCGSQNNRKKCVAIASPCGVMQATSKEPYTQALRCRIYALSYSGEGHNSLVQARQNAINQWEQNIEMKFGVKWADWFRSQGHVITCKKKRYRKRQCRARATPCTS